MSIVPYKVIRSKRRTLALTIDKEARLIVRAPMRLSEDFIRDFIKEKEQWISEKQQQARLYAAQYSTINLENGEEILYLGRPHIIHLQSVEEVTIAGDKLLVPEDMTLAAFKEWMKAESRALIRERVDYYAQ
ncbi:MAG: DUF45 domain-containing protein, partial [Eubacteriales bacterium]|nr:DUF45 domain-containing protein [Eubacteriales bacterium]